MDLLGNKKKRKHNFDLNIHQPEWLQYNTQHHTLSQCSHRECTVEPEKDDVITKRWCNNKKMGVILPHMERNKHFEKYQQNIEQEKSQISFSKPE